MIFRKNNHKKHRNSTALSNYAWKLKDNNTDFKIDWEILSRTKNKFNTRNGCMLCNIEKMEIAKLSNLEALNKRTELQSGCVHYRNTFL